MWKLLRRDMGRSPPETERLIPSMVNAIVSAT